MKIEGYGIRTFPMQAQAGRTAAALSSPSAPSFRSDSTVHSTEATPEISAQEKLRRLLDEKRTLTQTIFEPEHSDLTLGKHIDLRV